MSGLTDEGLVIETLEEIRVGMNADLQSRVGAQTDVSDSSAQGITMGIVAERLSTVWELAEVIHGMWDPDAATGEAQDQVCALTGVRRRAATFTTLVVTLTGDPTTVVDAGSEVSLTGTEHAFATDADATIAAVPAWAAITGYVVGNRVCATLSRIYECTIAGTSGASPPIGITDDETGGAGTAHFRFVGNGTGAIDATATATATGPVATPRYTVTTIETPLSGWLGVTNLEVETTLGSDDETDEDLRVRREVELSGPGTGTATAILADVLEIDGVDVVRVFVNSTDLTDADGVPPHAVEVLVQGGADQDIFDGLLTFVAAGIATHGTETGSATDSQGNVYVIKFSRPVAVPIYLDVTYKIVAAEYPSDGDAQVKAAIADYGNARGIGTDGVASRLGFAAFAVSGVFDVTATLIDDAPAPATSTTVIITSRQIATYATANIAVHTSVTTP